MAEKKEWRKTGPWSSRYHCVGCRKPMSFHTMMHSHGVCPMCGNTTRSTVVNCYTQPVRFIRTHRLFFWRGYWEEASNE
jgi:hypothetical protein